MSVQAIEAYNILKGKFSDEEAQKLVGYFESVSREGLATKVDLAEVKGELLREISDVKADLLKWMAGMLIAQAGLIAALVKLL